MKAMPFVLILTGFCSLTCCLGQQYHFIGTALSWFKAQTYCRERYADLATVFNVEDMNRLVNAAQDSTGGFTGKAWIGLHDNLTSWRWSHSDSRLEGDFTGHWDFGQPDNFLGNQMCVKMWSGGVWDDSQCFLRNPFICYNGTTRTDQRFIFVDEDLSWPDAQLYCRKHHTDLATVRDKKDNQEIQNLAKNRSVWIGLYRTREWSDQSVSNYRHWSQGQPDNVGGKQHCTATHLGNAGLWSDEQCSRELVFICYDKTPDKPVLSTMTPDKMITSEAVSTSTEATSPVQPSTTELHQTTSITDQTPYKSSQSTFTTVSQDERATEEVESVTDYPSTESSSSQQPSTQQFDQTTTISSETPNLPLVSTTEMTTAEGNSTTTEYSTPKVDQTRAIPTDHVINLRVRLTSRLRLSEDDIRELVSEQFRKRLIELGLSPSIKVLLKTPLK